MAPVQINLNIHVVLDLTGSDDDVICLGSNSAPTSGSGPGSQIPRRAEVADQGVQTNSQAPGSAGVCESDADDAGTIPETINLTCDDAHEACASRASSDRTDTSESDFEEDPPRDPTPELLHGPVPLCHSVRWERRFWLIHERLWCWIQPDQG